MKISLKKVTVDKSVAQTIRKFKHTVRYCKRLILFSHSVYFSSVLYEKQCSKEC